MKYYLSYIINPLNYDEEGTYFLGKGNSNQNNVIELDILDNFKYDLVSYDFHDLVYQFRKKGIRLPKSLVDVSHIGKLLVGKPHSIFKTPYPWSIGKLVEPYFDDDNDLKQLLAFSYGETDRRNKRRIRELLYKLNLVLKLLNNSQIDELRLKNEHQRYFSIEKPVNELLLQTQYNGICLDPNRLVKRLQNINKVIYSSSNILRIKWGLTDLSDSRKIISILKKLGYNNASKYVEKNTFDDVLELGSNYNEFFLVLNQFRKATLDKNSLLRSGALDQKRIYPVFDCLGTVTGRILVKHPNLQNLKRTSRDIICADKGHVLIYPDYSQFEPGILAHDSNDSLLINDYNKGDLYEKLSLNMFNNTEHRDHAKKIFMAYSYGMPKDSLFKLIVEVSELKPSSIRKGIEGFFKKYSFLDRWRENLGSYLVSDFKVGTYLGNYRYRNNLFGGRLTDAEKRWMISQRIQGTASLVLKKAILEIQKYDKEIIFLIPMHDAVLYQIPSRKYENKKKLIEDIFISTFRSFCLTIQPRVKFNSFAEYI